MGVTGQVVKRLSLEVGLGPGTPWDRGLKGPSVTRGAAERLVP